MERRSIWFFGSQAEAEAVPRWYKPAEPARPPRSSGRSDNPDLQGVGGEDCSTPGQALSSPLGKGAPAVQPEDEDHGSCIGGEVCPTPGQAWSGLSGSGALSVQPGNEDDGLDARWLRYLPEYARLVAEAPFEQSAPSEKKGYQQQQVTAVAEETAPRAAERPAAPESVSGTGGPARMRWTARRRQQRLEQENRSGKATDSGEVSVALSNAAEHAGPSEVPHGRANEGLDSTFIQLPCDEGDSLPTSDLEKSEGVCVAHEVACGPSGPAGLASQTHSSGLADQQSAKGGAAGADEKARGPDTMVVSCSSQAPKTERNPWGVPESGRLCVRLPALDIVDDQAFFSAAGATRMVIALRKADSMVVKLAWCPEANRREAEFARTGASAVCNVFAEGSAELNVGDDHFQAHYLVVEKAQQMDLERFEFGKLAFFQLAIAMVCQVSLEKYRPRDLCARNWGQRRNGQLVMLDAGRFEPVSTIQFPGAKWIRSFWSWAVHELGSEKASELKGMILACGNDAQAILSACARQLRGSGALKNLPTFSSKSWEPAAR